LFKIYFIKINSTLGHLSIEYIHNFQFPLETFRAKFPLKNIKYLKEIIYSQTFSFLLEACNV